MLFGLYVVVLASIVGLVDLGTVLTIATPVGTLNGNDVLLGLLLGVTLPAYVRRRRVMRQPDFGRLELAWFVFIGVVFGEALRSPASSITERLANLRLMSGYLIFLPTVALVDSWARAKRVAIIGVVFAVIGTGLTLAQSVYGLDALSDSPLYNLGGWNGNKQVIGGVTRVNLAISNWIAFTLLGVVCLAMLRFRAWLMVLAAVLCLAIVVNFARSLWLGMLAAVAVELVLLYAIGRRPVAAVVRGLTAGVAMLGGVVLVGAAIGFGLGGAVLERISEGLALVGSDQGNWAYRQVVAAQALDLWRTDPWWGVGLQYYTVFGNWIELGYAAALVSLGLVGTLVDLCLLAVSAGSGIAAARIGFHRGSPFLMAAGMLIPAQVTLMVVYQQWIDQRPFNILAFGCGLAAALVAIATAHAPAGQVERRAWVDMRTLARLHASVPAMPRQAVE